jgi:hypothetical protein
MQQRITEDRTDASLLRNQLDRLRDACLIERIGRGGRLADRIAGIPHDVVDLVDLSPLFDQLFYDCDTSSG